MALNTQTTVAQRNAMLDAIRSNYNSGFLRIYDGTQPATADTAVSTQTLLAELTFNATAAPASSSGTLTFNAITADSSANASGTATWFRCVASNGTTVLHDGTVGTASSNLVLNSVAISAGAAVSVSSFTYSIPAAGS